MNRGTIVVTQSPSKAVFDEPSGFGGTRTHDLVVDVLSLSDLDQQTTVRTHHEEGLSKIQTDAIDREIRGKFTTCLNHLNSDSHDPCVLVNIVTGRIASRSVR